MGDCESWLRSKLENNTMLCDAVRADAKEAGFSKGQLREARKNLGVKTFHQTDFSFGALTENWFWYLGG